MFTVLLTFDVEEFDILLEYGKSISLEEQLKVGLQGLNEIEFILSTHDIAATLYTTAFFATHFPDEIKALSHVHEIASHAYYHSKFDTADLKNSKEALEKITGQKVFGLRMPRLKKVPMADVKNAGYSYDSSINPTIIPRRYNNLHLPRNIYADDGMIRIPVSVSSATRIPLFWLAFKNFSYQFFLNLCKKTLQKDGYINLYFHPWEFADLSNYKLPSYISKPCGKKLQDKLHRLITDLKPHAEFSTTKNYLVNRNFISL